MLLQGPARVGQAAKTLAKAVQVVVLVSQNSQEGVLTGKAQLHGPNEDPTKLLRLVLGREVVAKALIMAIDFLNVRRVNTLP